MSDGVDGSVPHGYKVGDLVIARVDIGGLFRPRVKRQSHGMVMACQPGGELDVHFIGGPLITVKPTMLEHE